MMRAFLLIDYARYFDLPEHEIEQGRSQKITVVHHDELGKIVRCFCHVAKKTSCF
jgi:poly-beta-1,6-N-acetyl-D-glucosamine biosynthesis protein PgaD